MSARGKATTRQSDKADEAIRPQGEREAATGVWDRIAVHAVIAAVIVLGAAWLCCFVIAGVGATGP